MKKEKTKIHPIPIYDMRLEFCVTPDMIMSQKNKERSKRLGGGPISDYEGLCWFSERREIAVLITDKHLTHELIAHETLHATCQILRYVGVSYDPENQEAFSYLCGYITNLIYKDLKRWGLKVK